MEPVMPIYFQIAQIIKKRIITKDYKLGEKIPPEKDLINEFNVSRLTVRQAISQLVQEDLLNRKRGSGTYVTRNKKLINSFSIDYMGFVEGLYGDLSDVKVKSAIRNKVFASNYVKDKLELSDEVSEVIQFKRLRLKPKDIYVFTINYLPVEIGKRINENKLTEKPFINILVQDIGIKLFEYFVSIESVLADQETAKYLKIIPGFPVLCIEKVLYDNRNKPVQLVQSFYRGDMRKYIYKLRRMEIDNRYVWIQLKPE